MSIDKFSLETDNAQVIFFKGKRIGILFNYTTTINPGYKFVEKLHGETKWYMMENKDFVSNISFISKNENGNLVSFNGRSDIFEISIEQFCFLYPTNAKNFKIKMQNRIHLLTPFYHKIYKF